MDDQTLATAAARGDQEAFAALVERYRRYVYAIAYRIVLDEDDALDVAQNVVLRLAERIGQFEGRGPFRAWLATLATNEALTFLRRARRRRETPTDPADLERMEETGAAAFAASSASNNPIRAVETNQRRRLVENAMTRLSPQQRAVFALRFKEDMGPLEIARHLGIPPQQVRSQLHSAVERLRKAVKDD